MDRETLEDEYNLAAERYETLYNAYSELAVLMDAVHRENELLRADSVGAGGGDWGASTIATSDASKLVVEARTAELQRYVL